MKQKIMICICILGLITAFTSCRSDEKKTVQFSYITSNGYYQDGSQENGIDSLSAINSLHAQYASLQSHVSSCNAITVFLQDTASKRYTQGQYMNVSMTAGNKIKNVDLTQNEEQKIESIHDSYEMMNLICKSLNVNIGTFNSTYHTSLPFKSVVFQIYGLEIQDMKDGL